MIARVAENAAFTRSRSAGWMCDERSSNVTDLLSGTPQSWKALSSIVNRLVSTFHDHSATPAAATAKRNCSASQTGKLESSGRFAENAGRGTALTRLSPWASMFFPEQYEL